MDGITWMASMLGIPVWMLWVVIGGGVYATYLSTIGGKGKEAEQMATSGYAKLSELKAYNKKNGIQLSKDFFLEEKYCFEHIAVLGPTGAGKTTSIFYPNLLQKESFSGGNASIICTDPKGELYKDTSNFQRKLGRKVIMFSPLEPQYSFKYNPLSYCETSSEVSDLAMNLLASGTKAMEISSGKTGGGGSDWLNMAKPLLASALLYSWHQPRGLNTIANAIDLILESNDEQLQAILGGCKFADVRTQFNLFNQAAGSEKTVSSIKITLSSNLQLYTEQFMKELTSDNTYNFKDLRNTPTALYITYPERHSAKIAPLLCVFFTQLINELMKDKNLKGNYLPTYFLFDEFANIGQIPNFATLASTVRSRKISFLCCLQSKNQLKNLYGNYDEDILNNLKTKCIYGAMQDIATTEYVSKQCGEVEIRTKSTTERDNRSDRGYSYSTSKKKLLTPDEVRRISKENILLLVQNCKPYLDKTNTYYTQNKYIENISTNYKMVSY